ncbi:right-handed parallel beta-helix repeat-containing protein [Actinocrinis puniceicyclus]|uniref:Right-handed parallel beta-helix repeat-containing protein n=1 Tax=Actinocrinis puniceicyclus TaxID=977794 RepID=A0A8J7WMG9_9ACTN|nr:right-handed parallel beta-helix repeat-containing protein [Actinocrinis puniceicyclus]MBS2965096.1 right-handed parallel beta-helix repeat-containing protein [Actinocrinis puniceicyclus]
MFLRRMVVPAAALAVGAAFVPFSASAATPHQSHQSPAQRSSTLVTKTASSDLKTFTAPASKSVRLQKAATTTVKSRTATGTTIYAAAYTFATCSNGTGAGTVSMPYCSIQNAVNAAVSGDTVAVLGSVGYTSNETVVVRTSGISIVGVGEAAWISNGGVTPSAPPLVLDGVSDVKISNLMLSAYGQSALEIIGSSNVSVDSSYANSYMPSGAISIDGASHGITVTRSFLDGQLNPGLSAATGAADITVAGNILKLDSIVATGVSGLNLTGNTIQRSCIGAIDVEGASTGVSIENNLIEDANPDTNYVAGYKSWCTANSRPWNPDVTVAATASAGTVTDYNDFYVWGTDATALYSWSGVAYPALTDFRSATGQGAHDTIDSTKCSDFYYRPNVVTNVDVLPSFGSAAIGSANVSAPGQLSSDFFGVSPYTTRGAVQFYDEDPNLALGLTAEDTSAHGIALVFNVTSTNVWLNYTLNWGDGSVDHDFVSGSFATDTFSHAYPHAGTYPISVTLTTPQGYTVGNSVTVTTAGSEYTAYGPVRILDTRKGLGTGGRIAKLGADSTLKLQVAGAGTTGDLIPAGITALVVNLTVANPTATGYLTAYPNEDPAGAPQSRPKSSNVNFSPGQSVPNLAIVPVGPDGGVDLYNGSGGTVDVIADVSGYFSQTTAAGYYSMDPYRLVDTRKGVGAPQAQVSANGSISVQIDGADRGELPTSGVTAVALNVTAVNAKAGGYLTVYPDGTTRPTASNLNFSAGQVIANAVIVPVGTDGKIRVFNGSSGGTDVLVDVVGYYSSQSKSAYVPVAPVRVLDTRTNGGGPLGPGGYAIVYSEASVNDAGITAFVFNTTMTNTKGSGFETVAPDPNTLGAYLDGTQVWPTPPNVSTLNWTQGQVVPNLVQASTGLHGLIDMWNRSGGNTDLVVDEFGYYQAD